MKLLPSKSQGTLLAALGGAVLFSALGVALLTIQCSKKTIKADLFRMRGTVITKDTGTPLRNVEILLNANSRDTTDASGRYAFVEEIRTDRRLTAIPLFDSLPASNYQFCNAPPASVPANDTVWITNFQLCPKSPQSPPPCTCTVSH